MIKPDHSFTPATTQKIINALEPIHDMSMDAVVNPSIGDWGATAQTVSWALDQLRAKEELQQNA